MVLYDFKKHEINNFTAAEVEATGARLEDVQVRLMVAIQAFRVILGRRISLIPNGITTGKHKAPEHLAGLAIDCYLHAADGPITVSKIVKAALTAGFKGIGVYWNGQAFSFHLDLRADYAFWYGEKDGVEAMGWNFKSLFVTP